MESIQGFLLINLYAFLLIISTSIIFFSKKRLNQFEDKTYSKFLITNILISITGLLLGLLVNPSIKIPQFILIIFNKIYLVSLLLWISTLTLYTIFISIKNKKDFNKLKQVFKYIDIINIALVVILPMTLSFQGTSAVPSGLAIMYTYSIFCVGFISQIICVLSNFKNLKNKKYIPIYLLVSLGSLVVINQIINPEMNYLLNPLFIFITVIMYHTIENPDIKTLSELYKNKELVEQSYEDKSNFLFELTQQVRTPLLTLSKQGKNLENIDDITEIKKEIKELNNHIRQLDFIVNDVLDISTLDAQKVKFVENRYNLNNLYTELVSKVQAMIPKDVEFISTSVKNISYLYGDSIKLKQILYSLLLNAIKKTDKGFIEFHIDVIERYDVCRLIFSIKDSGYGMSLNKINDILAVTGEINQDDIKALENTEINMELCQKIVKLFGGNLMIKSEVGKGTEIVLSIDQKKETNKEIDYLNSYANLVRTNKKVLIVSQDKKLVKTIKNKLKSNDINYSYMLYGLDAIDQLKSGKEYDYIIVDDEMNEMSGYTTLKEMKKLKKFNTPVIVMLRENKENIKEHYIKEGFNDYMLIKDLTKEINRIIEKY